MRICRIPFAQSHASYSVRGFWAVYCWPSALNCITGRSVNLSRTKYKRNSQRYMGIWAKLDKVWNASTLHVVYTPPIGLRNSGIRSVEQTWTWSCRDLGADTAAAKQAHTAAPKNLSECSCDVLLTSYKGVRSTRGLGTALSNFIRSLCALVQSLSPWLPGALIIHVTCAAGAGQIAVWLTRDYK
jgi:hypothetical protein